jgi:hypothetical protein
MGLHIMNNEKALQFTVEHFLHDAECILENGTPMSLGLAERHRRVIVACIDDGGGGESVHVMTDQCVYERSCM